MRTPNPSDLDKVLEKINEIAKESATGDYIYRGEPAHHEEHPHCGKVSSSLYREYHDIETEHFDIAVVQADILKAAHEYTLHKMEDFELLATLQHFGDKTNLIDFTTDYLVALFFACDGESGESGRVILLPKQSEVYTVEKPPRTIRRAEIQKSIFVQAPQGFVKPNKVVSIPADLKATLLDYLRRHHDISTKTIYNDLQGFIEKRGLHKSAYTEFYEGLTCQKRGHTAETQGEKQQWADTAIAHYTEAVGLQPDLVEAYNNRGNVYSDKGEVDTAIQDYNKAIDLNPEYAEAYNNRGNAYSDKGEVDTAIQDFDKAIDLNPEYADGYYNRGNAYSDKGEVDTAIQDYSRAIDLNSEDADAYNNRGVVYGKKGDFDAAIQDYNTAIDLNPEYTKAYYNRGEAWLHLRDWEKAKDDLTAAKDMGIDIAASFRNNYKNVEDFEAKNAVQVPEDIAALLRGE